MSMRKGKARAYVAGRRGRYVVMLHGVLPVATVEEFGELHFSRWSRFRSAQGIANLINEDANRIEAYNARRRVLRAKFKPISNSMEVQS